MQSEAVEVIPTELPEKPDGWKTTMTMHVSMSDKKAGRYGIGVYDIFDDKGRKTPIGFSYNSHPTEGHRGFTCRGTDKQFKSWPELRTAWPELRATLATQENEK